MKKRITAIGMGLGLLCAALLAGLLSLRVQAEPVAADARGFVEAVLALGDKPGVVDEVLAARGATPMPVGAENSPEARERSKRWAFEPVKAVPIPENGHANPIDAQVAARLARAGLEMSAPADKRTLIRRIYLDMLGLPPSPEEVDAFVKDERPEAYAALVDSVLASPHYGERWARHWLDVARFGETNGFETNTPRKSAWRYRDWVIDALNRDEPYDQFIREQIAGDALGAEIATGFLVGGPMDEVKSPDIVLTKNQRDGELHDMVSTIGSAVLGLTLGCAKCHDHKFDPIKTKDYYALRACFAGVKHGERELHSADDSARLAKVAEIESQAEGVRAALMRFAPLADVSPEAKVARPAPAMDGLVEHFAPVNAKAVRITIAKTSEIEPCIDEIEVYAADGTNRNVARATAGGTASASSEYPNVDIHKISHLNDGLYGNAHSWIAATPGEGWAQIDFAKQETIDCVLWERDREGKYDDRVATDYVVEVLGENGAWMAVASSRDRAAYVKGAKKLPGAECLCASEADRASCTALREQLAKLEKAADDLGALPRAYAGRFEQPEATHLLYRGDPMMERDEVAPGAPEVVLAGLSLPADAPEQQRRLQLAAWLTDARNPLTARVIVNRLWQHHLGHAIVDTPGDFGAMGTRPTHPELLDWLAAELLRQGWHLKALHREMLLSETYQQASTPNPNALAADADARLLWRFPPTRLEAEPIRDSILAVSGALDLTMGGPGWDAFQPNESYVHIYVPKEEFGPTEFRRMIYQWKPRKEQDITFGVFDCPDATQSAVKRNRSTTPLQALNLFNSPFMQQQATLFAQRVEREAGAETAARIVRAFQLALGRAPEAAELEKAQAFVEHEGLAVLCRTLFNTSEFLYID